MYKRLEDENTRETDQKIPTSQYQIHCILHDHKHGRLIELQTNGEIYDSWI